MAFRGRPRIGRPQTLASALAALLVLAGTGTAVAETSVSLKPPPEPRVQHPGDVAGYRLPFAPGLDVYIHQGWNAVYSHNGRSAYAYDFGLHLGTPVLASATGVVSYVHSGETACGGASLRNHANYVTIDHPDGSSTQYGHLATVEVEVGDLVQVGQEIATSGMTGYTGCQPHLHFARQIQGSAVTQSIPIYFDDFADRQLVGGETIQATPTCAKVPVGSFCATYRGGADDDAPVLFARVEKAIDDNWAKKGPGGYWLDDPVDGFAATWTGQVVIDTPGVYTLEVRASDRVRVSIDGLVLVDARREHVAARDLSVAWRATPGRHDIEIQHVDVTGKGSLHVAWTPLLLDGAWVRWAEAEPEA